MERHGEFMPNRTYLVSYPRSGANWLRYCVEVISKKITHGVKPLQLLTPLDASVEEACRSMLGESLGVEIDPHSPVPVPIMQHSHRWESSTPDTKIVTIVRNFKECILRDYRGTMGDDPLVKEIAVQNSLEILCNIDGIYDYAHLLGRFVEHSGPKHLVYYEDLKSNPAETLANLCLFLDVDPTLVDRFIDKFSEHNDRSVRIYSAGVARSYTQGSDNLSYHSDQFLSAEAKRSWDRHIAKNYPRIVPIVGRYFEDK